MTLTSLTVKDFIGISRMAEVMLSEGNLFSSSSIIFCGLGLKTLERCIANVSAFSLSLLVSLVLSSLFPDKRILYLRSF